ncbi:MAG: hypothetical protein A2X28_09160 [Elusimicrobia bacterium GWA2_56_46]|nr:MAG: hypothetical protein A2X28_09160 [Elusimicrobia bacterium GWA2_56_46]OGR54471.1 MAG: hypothetical protein A2X39_04240 [Elusimicrobia bacterium GWC2_56_31]HBB66724.1 hypothetical protein [Elusimicrobiota bacterium]HBW22549.1 hypothetical protein [Elusimicrobiota bacterium]
MPGTGSALKFFLTLAFPLFLNVPHISAAEDVYKKIANDFVRYSVDKKVRNVAVIAFSRKARASREESEYFSEKLLACLAESGKINLLERSQLGRVLEERRLAAAGVTEESPGDAHSKINPSDAIIVGTIFGTKDQLKIIARMIDPLTGAVLHTVQAQTERQWDIMPDWPDSELEVPDMRVVAAMFRDEELNPQSSSLRDFRDAPVSFTTETCNARRVRLSAMQAAALGVKAKYWALQMRDPDFDSGQLRRNPGAEIADPVVRKKFYALLDVLYKARAVPPFSAEELSAVVYLMGEEGRLSDECGLH